MHLTSRVLLLTTATLLAPLTFAEQHDAPAAQSDPQPASAEETEKALDTGLKNFGYLTGLAHGCVAEAQRTALEKQAMRINATVNRTLGGDRAFLYAASFGYGTNIQVEQQECADVLARFEKRTKAFEAETGGKE